MELITNTISGIQFADKIEQAKLKGMNIMLPDSFEINQTGNTDIKDTIPGFIYKNSGNNYILGYDEFGAQLAFLNERLGNLNVNSILCTVPLSFFSKNVLTSWAQNNAVNIGFSDISLYETAEWLKQTDQQQADTWILSETELILLLSAEDMLPSFLKTLIVVNAVNEERWINDLLAKGDGLNILSLVELDILPGFSFYKHIADSTANSKLARQFQCIRKDYWKVAKNGKPVSALMKGSLTVSLYSVNNATDSIEHELLIPARMQSGGFEISLPDSIILLPDGSMLGVDDLRSYVLKHTDAKDAIVYKTDNGLFPFILAYVADEKLALNTLPKTVKSSIGFYKVPNRQLLYQHASNIPDDSSLDIISAHYSAKGKKLKLQSYTEFSYDKLAFPVLPSKNNIDVTDTKSDLPLAYIEAPMPSFPGDFSFTLTGHLKKVASGNGTITFVREDRTEKVVTYKKLLSDAESIASGLLKLNIPIQTPVLLQLEDQASWITMYWAVLLNRFIAAPLAVPKVFSEENDTVQKLKNILKLLDNPLVICERKNHNWYEEQFKNWGYSDIRLLIWEEIEFAQPATLPEVQPDDVALYMFTSGSTGLPKCIRQTHNALVFRNYSVGLHCGFSDKDIFLNWMPLDHIGGIQMAHNNAVVNGGSQVSIPIEVIISDPVYWIELIDKYRASYTWSPNFAFNQLSQETEKLKTGRWDLSCMRHWLTGGESVSASVTRQVIELLMPHGLHEKAVFPAYGMSETCSGITHALDFDGVHTGLNHIVQSSMNGVLSYKVHVSDDTVCLVEVGPPVPGISLRITDRSSNILTENQIGLLQVTGPTITKGYLKNEEANQQLLPDGWFNTGDLGFIKDGVLTITGREKDLIIINGLNYQNYELERYIEELPEIGSNGTIAASSFDPEKGREILYVFFKSANKNYKSIAARIRSTLVRTAGVSPDVIIALRDIDFLVTTSGKKRRPVVLDQYLGQNISPLYDSSEVKNEGYDSTLFFKEEWLETPIVADSNDANEHWLISDSMFADVENYFSRVFTHSAWAEFLHNQEINLQYVSICYDVTNRDITFSTKEWLEEVKLLKQLFKNAAPAKFQYITKGLVNHNSSKVAGYIPGLMSSIAEELEYTQVKWVDTDASETNLLPEQLKAESTDTAKFTAISYNNGNRYQQLVASLQHDTSVNPDTPIKENGFYLVTGGFGGVGSFLLRKLIDKYNIKALVIGRTDLNTDKVHGSIFDFENRAFDRKAIFDSFPKENIIYRCCNLADAASLQAIVNEFEKENGKLDGYFHLAGVARLTYHWEHINEHLFTEEKPEVFEWMLQSKVQGTLNLEQIFYERKDFLRVVFGSVNAYFGANSFSTYAAVNSFIRFFTEEENRKGKNFHTIHWSQWKGLGMSEGNEMDALSINRGYSVIEPEEGWKALLNILRLDPGNYISGLQPQNKYIQDTTLFPSYKQSLIALKDPAVSDKELLPLEKLVGSPLSSWQLIAAHDSQLWNRTSWSEDYLSDLTEESGQETTLSTQTEAVLIDIWKDLLDVDRIRLTDNFFQLGGHSIKATRMMARVKDRFHVQLPFSALFNYATLSDLASHIEELKGKDADISIPAAQKSDYYPLSPAQYRLWMVHKMEGGGHAYLVPGIYDIEGKLDIECFRQAINALVEKHEILRTVFIEKGNTPYQKIEENVTTCFTFHRDPINVEGDIKKLIDTGLSLDGSILFHCHLFKTGNDKYRLLVLLHHINADGVTLAILRRDLAALYTQYISKQDVSIDIPAIQYKDFSVWYDSYLASPECTQLRSYWLDKFSGQLPVLDMPADYPRKPKQSFKGASIDLKLDNALTSKLEEIAANNRMSVFAVLISLVKTVLWRHSGQNDVIVGTSTDLRINAQLEQQVGQYVNVLPLRDTLDDTLYFDKLLLNVNNTLVKALEHKLYPFEKLITELQLDRDTSRSPLFSILLVMHNFETSADTLSDTKWTPVHHDNDTSKFDYVFAFRKENDGMLINLRYCTDLFYESRALNLLADIKALASGIASNTSKLIGSYQLAVDQSFQVKACTPFGEADFEDIITLFGQHVKKNASATAISYEGKTISYGEVYKAASGYASLCNRFDGRRIVVIKTPDIDWIASLLGIWMANKAYIPIDASFPEQVIIGQLKEVKPDAIFTTATLESSVRDWLEKAALADVDIYTEGAESNNAVEVTVDNWNDEAYIVFTSGSTGKPKGIIGNRRSLSQFINWEAGELGITPGIVTVSQLTQPTFDASLRDIFLALSTGNTLAIPSKDKRKDLSALATWLADRNVNIIHAVPSLLRGILASKPADKVFHIQHVLCAGEQLYRNDIRSIHETFGADVNVINLYGATESTLVKTYWQDGQQWHFEALPAGKGISDCDVLVLNGHNQLCAPGEKGEVYIRTPYISNGYLDTSLDEKAFIQNPLHNEFKDTVYRTGDIGRYTMEGWLQLAGRKDEQVKINGVRIELKEIELAAVRIPAISEAVAKAWQQEEIVSIALYYVSASLTEEAVQEELKKMLPTYAQPAFIVRLDAVPMNANGKVDKSKLPDPHDTTSEKIVAPEISIHPTLLTAWAQALKMDVAEANNGKNFFQSGGNSLLAMILLAKVQQGFGVRIPIEVFFRDPSLVLLQSYVPEEVTHKDEGIKALPQADTYALSHAQQRMWILNEMETNNITYNVKRAFTLNGDVNIDALKESVAGLVHRHEVLRTSFHYMDGKVVQSIHKDVDIADCFIFEDLSATDNPKELAREKIDVIFSKPFRLDTYPLLKVALLKTAANEYSFCLVKHHIISDGWSMEVISKELIDGYNTIVKEKKYQPAVLPFNYKDFAAWQNNYLQQKAVEDDEAYWLNKFSNIAEPIELPADRPRFAVKTYNGDLYKFTIDKQLSERLRQFSEEQHATVFMVMLSAINLLFYRYTGARDITIGTPSAGRRMPGLENQLGFYVNTLALRTVFDPEDSFTSLLDKTRKTTLDALEHQDYPFDRLIEKLDLEKRMDHSPLFDVVVQFMNTSVAKEKTASFDNITVAPFETTWHTSQFDQNFFFTETPDGIQGVIEYNTDLFDKETIVREITHITNLLAALVDDPELAVNKVQFLTSEETEAHNKLLNTQATYPLHSMYSQFEIAAERHADKNAIITTAGNLSYTDLKYNADRLAGLLKQVTQDKQVRIALLMDEGVHAVISMLASLKTACCYVPVAVTFPYERMRYMLSDSEATVLIFSKNYLKQAGKLYWECGKLEYAICIDSNDVFAEREPLADIMSEELWNFIGQSATDDITGGAWFSSYTGLPISRLEMDEYADNSFTKLKPYLNKNTRVLEIGCASAITMSLVAPYVQHYTGTDLSSNILEIADKNLHAKDISNYDLIHAAAHEVADKISDKYDVVILNSVVQCFSGYNYLRQVIESVLPYLSDDAVIFFGDIQDLDKKDALEQSLRDFAAINDSSKVKLDWSQELFVPKAFFDDLRNHFHGVIAVTHSEKLGTVKNELTEFRYDTIVHIRKEHASHEVCKTWYDRSDIETATALDKDAVTNLDTPAYIIYTSGSTGNPKGCIITHRNLIRLFFNDRMPFDFSEQDVWIQSHGYHFDFSVWEIYGAILYGGTVVIPDREEIRDISRYYSMLKQNKVTVLNQTPRAFYNFSQHVLQNNDPHDIASHLRYVVFGGEKLQPARLKEWMEQYPSINMINMYGITETTVHVTFHKVTMDEVAKMPYYSVIGHPIPATTVSLKDAHGNAVPFNVPAEMLVGGTGVSLGYFNRPELTTEKFIPDINNHGHKVYRSGDYGKLLPNGDLVYINRRDAQVKIRGYRIETGEIENALLQHPEVDHAAVIVRTDNAGDNNLVAYYTGTVADKDILRKFLSVKLPSYMVPAAFVQLDTMPMTINGKLDVKRLPDPNALGVAFETIDENDLSHSEQVVWKAFCEVLGTEQIGLNDNFFEHGGHSLKAMNLMSLLHSRIRVGVPLVYLYKFPTVKEIAHYIDCARYMNIQYKEHPYLQLGNPEGKRTLILFPPALGSALAYSHLAELLDDTKLFSFNYVDNKDTMHNYVRLLNELQPEGELYIAGHSAGGFMAFHVAKEMEKVGRKVGGVIILDAFRQGKEGKQHTLETIAEGVDQYLAYKFNEYKDHFIDMDFFKEVCYNQVKQYYDFLFHAEQEGGIFIQAPIHFMVAENNYERQENWTGATAAGVKVYYASGVHGRMVDEPWVQPNAVIINDIIKQQNTTV